MKTYILLLFLLIVSIIPASAQPYESFFGEEETHVIKIFPEIFPFPQAELKLNNQTLVWHGYTTGLDVPYFEGSFTCFIDIIDGHNQEKSLLVF